MLWSVLLPAFTLFIAIAVFLWQRWIARGKYPTVFTAQLINKMGGNHQTSIINPHPLPYPEKLMIKSFTATVTMSIKEYYVTTNIHFECCVYLHDMICVFSSTEKKNTVYLFAVDVNVPPLSQFMRCNDVYFKSYLETKQRTTKQRKQQNTYRNENEKKNSVICMCPLCIGERMLLYEE